MGGDLNFSLGTAEIWGPKEAPCPLSDLFIHQFDLSGMVDVEPPKLNPTWRNRWVGEDRISKRMDKFLVGEDLVSSPIQIRQWVDSGRELDHNLVILELRGGSQKPLIPFKFNVFWLKDPMFLEMIK